MAKHELKIALISGGMYDRLYDSIAEFERSEGAKITIGFRGTHPELNAHLAAGNGQPYDLVSAHTKYAPSQQHFLAPIEGFDTTDFFPTVLDLASIDGVLYGIPRNIDLRLLHYRTDWLDSPPATWDALVNEAKRLTREHPSRYGFVFTGMESGLFGTFFELVESSGAHLFPTSVNNEGGRWALHVLRELYSSGAAPHAVAEWHYDEVHQAFRSGMAAMACDWPGYYGSYNDVTSPVRDCFRVACMPAGPGGRTCCYAGSHTFALTRAGARKEEAHALLRFLTAPPQQAVEASQGSVPVRLSLMEEMRRAVAHDEAEAARLALLRASIERDLIVPPKLSYYPVIEDILWRTVRAAVLGELSIAEALVEIERRITGCVADAVAR